MRMGKNRNTYQLTPTEGKDNKSDENVIEASTRN